MKKIFLFLIILTIAGFSQQLNHTWGVDVSGSAMTKIAEIDTTAATTNTFYVDIDDFYFVDWYPLTVTDVMTITGSSSDTVGVDSIYGSSTQTVYSNSTRQYIGTLYTYFDNWGVKAPTTDSLAGYTINVAPGVYNSTSYSIANVDWGTNVVLETVRQAGDYLSIKNVYVHASVGKSLPPRILRFQINAPATSNTNLDDSTEVSWDFVYPAIYHVHEVQKP